MKDLIDLSAIEDVADDRDYLHAWVTASQLKIRKIEAAFSSVEEDKQLRVKGGNLPAQLGAD